MEKRFELGKIRKHGLETWVLFDRKTCTSYMFMSRAGAVTKAQEIVNAELRAAA